MSEYSMKKSVEPLATMKAVILAIILSAICVSSLETKTQFKSTTFQYDKVQMQKDLLTFMRYRKADWSPKLVETAKNFRFEEHKEFYVDYSVVEKFNYFYSQKWFESR